MITMDNVNEASQQEVFDQVARHLLRQGEQSTTEDNGCAYRGDNGLMCAVGCLMTDRQYTITYCDFEEHTASSLPGVNGSTGELLDELQLIHDGSDPLLWGQELSKLAHRYHLNTDALKENTNES